MPQYLLYGGAGWGTGINATCSTGFSVSRIAAPSVVGYVTAGHCGDPGETTFASAGGAWITQGVIRGSTFPGRDYAWIEVTDEWTPRPYARRTSNTLQIIQGWQPAGIGATVCRSGITTGWRCGEITATNVTVNTNGGTVTGLTRTSACAASGDSGGPYLTGWHGQGVHVASTGTCSSGGTAYFQPLVPILDAYDLRLTTAGSGSTPPLIRNMNCQYDGRFIMSCLVSQYHPDPVTVRWTVNGTPRSSWNDDVSVTGPCGEGGNSVRVTVSNGSGSATASRSVRCTGQAP
jgi:streptogrisin C